MTTEPHIPERSLKAPQRLRGARAAFARSLPSGGCPRSRQPPEHSRRRDPGAAIMAAQPQWRQECLQPKAPSPGRSRAPMPRPPPERRLGRQRPRNRRPHGRPGWSCRCRPSGLTVRSCTLRPRLCRVYPGCGRLARGAVPATCPCCRDATMSAATSWAPRSGLPPWASLAEWIVLIHSSGSRSSSQLGGDPSAPFQTLLERLRGHPLHVPVGVWAGIAFRQQERPDRSGRQRGCRGMPTNRPFPRQQDMLERSGGT